MPWLLNIAYVFFLLAVAPVLLYRRLVHGKYRDGWSEKLWGRLPPPADEEPRIWFHAVSVGEVLQLEPILDALRRRRPDVAFLISTTTETGLTVARSKYPSDEVCYFPLDFSWTVRRAIRVVRPAAIVLVELELWPNFILEARRAGIPLALINGRIGEKSFQGYRRIRPLMKRLLGCFGLLAVQYEVYRHRLVELGAPQQNVHITGSVKFDRIETNRANSKTEELRKSFGIAAGQRVFIAGSTQAPEEEISLNTWLDLRTQFPELRLILVPRHKERFDEVAQLVTQRGLPLVRRSRLLNDRETSANADRPVLLLDTLGELSACWGLADIAFVGGSLTNRGGQNMIEPAAYRAAVLFGPNTHNFRDVVESLLDIDAARVVPGAKELTAAVRKLLESPEEAEAMGRRAQKWVLTQKGAAERTIELLLPLLQQTDAKQADPQQDLAA